MIENPVFYLQQMRPVLLTQPAAAAAAERCCCQEWQHLFALEQPILGDPAPCRV